MLRTLRRLVEDTPLEPAARWAYVRLWPSQSARHDREAGAVMARVLKRGSNSIDVGAHRGTMLRQMVALAPDGKHYAVEPHM